MTQPDSIMSAEHDLAIYIIECYRGMHVESPPQHPLERSIKAVEKYREAIRNAALEEAAKVILYRGCHADDVRAIRNLKKPPRG